MTHSIDLTGKRFGKLTVLRLHPEPYIPPSGKGKIKRWVCRCDCGNETTVLQSALLAKKYPTKSCGCLSPGDRPGVRNRDLTGQRFGMLTVLRLNPEPYISPSGKSKIRRWVCRCDCGNEIVVLQSKLLGKNHPKTNCGCLNQNEGGPVFNRDLTGLRVGKLTVLHLSDEPYKSPSGKGSARRWVCLCDCGNETVVTQNRLISRTKPTRSCGCLSSGGKPPVRNRDLVGQRFGRLTVLRLDTDSPHRKNHKRYWVCQCDCGNVVSVTQSSLLAERYCTRSCGCLRQDISRAAAEDLEGMRFGRLLVVRREELPKPTVHGIRYGWLCRCDCGNERIYLTETLKQGLVISCGCYRDENASTRAKTNGGNVFERYEGTSITNIRPGLKLQRNNKSGTTGVYFETSSQRWAAVIYIKRKRIRLGRFEKKEDAIKARKLGEEKYFAPVLEKYEAEKKEAQSDDHNKT